MIYKQQPNINKYLSRHGLKTSRRRNVIAQVFSKSNRHQTVDELYEQARLLDPKVGYTTVWRTLKLLTSMGLALPHRFHDGQTRYEYTKRPSHHDHLVCINCGGVEEFINTKIEEMQRHIALKHKFTITSHKMELYGLCKKCNK